MQFQCPECEEKFTHTVTIEKGTLQEHKCPNPKCGQVLRWHEGQVMTPSGHPRHGGPIAPCQNDECGCKKDGALEPHRVRNVN